MHHRGGVEDLRLPDVLDGPREEDDDADEA